MGTDQAKRIAAAISTASRASQRKLLDALLDDERAERAWPRALVLLGKLARLTEFSTQISSRLASRPWRNEMVELYREMEGFPDDRVAFRKRVQSVIASMTAVLSSFDECDEATSPKEPE